MVTGSNPVRRAIFGSLVHRIKTCYGGCSSVGRALDCDSSCRGFESRHSPHIRSMAQSGSAPGLGPGGRRFKSYCSDHHLKDEIKYR